MVLLDIKQIDNEKHKKLTKKNNINTLQLAKWLEENNKPFWLRYVLVPGISDAKEDLIKIGKHFTSYKMLKYFDILPYHKFGIHKYDHLNLNYKLPETNENSKEELQMAEHLLSQYFKNVRIC